MPELSPDDSEALTALIGVYGEGIVEQYAKATFPTVVIKLKNLSAKNASEWINIKRFTDWIVTASQDLDDTLPASQNNTTRALGNTPSASQGTPFRSRTNIPFNTPINDAFQTPTYTASYRAPSSSLPPSSPPGYSPVREPLSPPPLSDSPDLPELFVPTPIEKRKRQSTGDSDMPIIISNPPSSSVKPKKKKKKKAKAVSPKVVINRQTTARELVVLPVQPLPPYFDVPHDKNEVAYLLDLNEHPDLHRYRNKEGIELNMGQLIIQHNHDALQQHKSNTRRTKVVALDNAECFVLGFNCKGVCHCSEFDTARLNMFERYEADEVDMKKLFDAERDLSQHSAQSLAARVATFFHEANNEPCRKEGCKRYLLKTCITHFERKVDELAKVCEKKIIDKVRACQFAKTQAEADELVEYYKSCPQKCVRDWIADKEQAPWFLPSINEYLSKIPARIWYETDMTTNINESAHPFTNKMTGIGRPLAESIERARTADRMVFEQLDECSQRCVLLNTKNTFSDRHHANRLRQESRIRTKAEKASKEEQLARLNDVIKDAQQQKKVLSQAGVKAPRAKKGSRGKNTPNAVEMRRSSSPPSPSPQRGNLEGAAFEFSSGSFRAGGFDVVTGWGDLGSTDLNAQLLSELTGDVSTWDFGTFLAAPGPSLSTIPEQAPADSTPPASRASTWTPWSGSMTQSGSSQPATQSTAIGSAMQSLAVPSSRPLSGGVLGWSPDAA